jgi:hypothetical protein
LITIIRYKDDKYNQVTENISKICDQRIIWGGDKTINQIRKFELKPKASDITFSDRTSLSILNAEKIVKAKKKDLSKLIRNFYNDTYAADQNACSSPNLILWYGSDNILLAKEKFWQELNKKVIKDYNIPDIASLEKYNKLCIDSVLLKNFKSNKIYNNYLYLINLSNLNNEIETLKGKWGYFYQYEMKNLKDIKNYLSKKFQTLTYYGFEKKFMANFIKEFGNEGIDRVVPVGCAQNMGLTWDGYEIIPSLTRKINIQ